MANPTPPLIQLPLLRRLAYVVLALESVLFVTAALGVLRRDPDTYSHEHLRSLINPIPTALLILVFLARNVSARWILMVVASAFVGAGFVLAFLR